MSSRSRILPVVAIGATMALSALLALSLGSRSRSPAAVAASSVPTSTEPVPEGLALQRFHHGPRLAAAPLTALPDGPGAAPAPPRPFDAYPVVADDDLVLPYPGLAKGACPKGTSPFGAGDASGCGYVPDVPDAGMVRNGPWVEVRDTIRLTGQYVDDRREGPWEGRDEKGRLREQLGYDHEQPQGYFRTFDEDGVLVGERHYEHGALHGVAMTRLPDGSVLRETFDRGVKVATETSPPPATSLDGGR